VLAGSANDQLADLAEHAGPGRLARLQVGALEAELAGLSCGGWAQCLVVPAADLPAGLWERLERRDPVGLVTRLHGDTVTEIELVDPATVEDAGRGVSGSLVEPDRVTSVFWPVPKLVIVGGGAVADALGSVAELLGWRTQVVSAVSAATGVIAGLAALDRLVVISHDDDLAGPALAAALAGPVGYIGALGSRRTQQARADWLAYRGITDLDRVHGPAGLDIGARTPAEIAVAIAAEALAVHSGRGAGALRERSGAIH
jgi:xanthine dehydrogenase accessory factor